MALLTHEVRDAIYRRLLLARTVPFHYFKRLHGRHEYRMRVGDYRVIADIRGRRIDVTIIGHRKNIYD